MILLGNFFFHYRNVLFPLVFLMALLAGKPDYPFARPDMNIAFDAAGVLLAVLGQALRILTIGYEYIIRGGKDRRVYATSLVQGGVFAHCRNPLYVGNLLIVVGLALVIHSRAFYLIFLPFIFLAYSAIVAAEEAFLFNKFGAEYTEYCRRVNRWWPRFAGFRRSVGDMRFNWKRVLVKEYNTTFVLAAALLCFERWGKFSIDGPAALPSVATLTAVVLLWLGLYLLVRTLKKSGYVKP
jgi:protein-S-isoprenylcysteine O-methyltransferase Ste14